jgi:serine protease AprX
MRHATIPLLLVSSITMAYGAGPKIDPELKDLASDRVVDVIVQYRSTPTEAHHRLVLAHGGQLKHNLAVIRAAHYSVPANQVQALSDDPEVEFVSPDRVLSAAGHSDGGYGNLSWYTGLPDYGYQAVGADLAGTVFGLDGTGVGIALIDSGVDDDLNDLAGSKKISRVVYRISLLQTATQVTPMATAIMWRVCL